MTKESKTQSSDKHLFRQETQDVVPLNTPARSDSRAPRKPTRSQQRHSKPRELHPNSESTAARAKQASSGETISYRRDGVQIRLLQKLKRGRFPAADQLDLHHETVAAAHIMLQDFIADAQNRQLQCIRVIHGKGLRSEAGPVLKHMVHKALREHAGVLAFTACKPAHGGSGAVDVLLRTT